MIARLLWFYWDPNPIAFQIPVLDLPVFIYALFFVSGFILGYFLLIPIFSKALSPQSKPSPEVKKQSQQFVDTLTWFVVIGTVIGARLGHVIFYDWERYRHNLLSILNTREGGLASHGGTVGVLLALFLFHRFILQKKTPISFLKLLDMVVIPTALVAFFIRMGNFFNQEIVGIPTSQPWGIIFGHPAEGGAAVPRHPTQLYEGVCYLFIFLTLYALWKYKGKQLKGGFLTGLFFVTVFGSRFLIEFFKANQASIIDQSFLQVGQILSIPFIILGVALIFHSLCTKKTFANN